MEGGTTQGEANPLKLKKFACVLCRRRKLKCDGQKPKCFTCNRLGHTCEYQEGSDEYTHKRTRVRAKAARGQQKHADIGEVQSFEPFVAEELSFNQPWCDHNALAYGELPSPILNVDISPLLTQLPSCNSLLPLGLEESLPAQTLIDELEKIYFDTVHPYMPMIHKPRYLIQTSASFRIVIPTCLRYAIWAVAASTSSKHIHLEDALYHRARKYVERDEIISHGESFLTLRHAQCWAILSLYELLKLHYPKAWMSSGRCTRLVQMLGLYQVDSPGYAVKHILPATEDWIELEERRRTFWVAYNSDKWASVGNGWPMTIDERDISTNLPSSEIAFQCGIPEQTGTLQDLRSSGGISRLSSFGGSVLTAYLVGRNFFHLRQKKDNDSPDDTVRGEYWKRHSDIDNALATVFMALPQHLRLPEGLNDRNVVFINMNLHSAIISLHMDAIVKAKQYDLDSSIISRSRTRNQVAAKEIVDLLRLTSHTNISKMNLFVAFNLFVAANVFVDDCISEEPQNDSLSNLQFLIAAMETITRTHPVTASFLIQLQSIVKAQGIQGGMTGTSVAVDTSVEAQLHHTSIQNTKSSHSHMKPCEMTYAEDLKQHNTLPISLEGVLPVRERSVVASQSVKILKETTNGEDAQVCLDLSSHHPAYAYATEQDRYTEPFCFEEDVPQNVPVESVEAFSETEYAWAFEMPDLNVF